MPATFVPLDKTTADAHRCVRPVPFVCAIARAIVTAAPSATGDP